MRALANRGGVAGIYFMPFQRASGQPHAEGRFLVLADDLAKRGWSTGRIEKILGANFARLFSEVWG